MVVPELPVELCQRVAVHTTTLPHLLTIRRLSHHPWGVAVTAELLFKHLPEGSAFAQLAAGPFNMDSVLRLCAATIAATSNPPPPLPPPTPPPALLEDLTMYAVLYAAMDGGPTVVVGAAAAALVDHRPLVEHGSYSGASEYVNGEWRLDTSEAAAHVPGAPAFGDGGRGWFRRAVHAALMGHACWRESEWSDSKETEWYDLVDWGRVELRVFLVDSTIRSVQLYGGGTEDGDSSELRFERGGVTGPAAASAVQMHFEPTLMHSRDAQVVLGGMPAYGMLDDVYDPDPPEQEYVLAYVRSLAW